MAIMDCDTTKYYRHLLDHLPNVKDPTLVILIGHLLVEELLTEVIEIWLKHPEVLAKARLTFHQKLILSSGIISSPKDNFTWEPIQLLNQMRNRISHKLAPHDLDLLVVKFLRMMYSDDFDDIPNDTYARTRAMRKAIIFHCAYLSGRIDVLKLHKSEVRYEKKRA